jgi:hypothetical protein
VTSVHANTAYRIPSVLRDLVLVDMLELTGSTVAAAQLLNLSQPSVSRRYRRLAAELGLQPNRRDKPGRRFCDADWMRLLRQGVNRHRLDCGVLRLGGPAAAEKWIGRSVWAEWIPLPTVSLAHANELLLHELLDGVVFDGEQGPLPSNSGLIQLPNADGASLWLHCRPDPLVLALAQQCLSLPIA